MYIKTSSKIIIILITIGIVGTMSLLYGYTLQPPHYTLEIHDMRDAYHIGEKFSFYYTLSGFGNTCHSWTVTYPDQNAEIKHVGEAIDCTQPTNKDFFYDSRKDSRKFNLPIPEIAGKYNVTVSLENIEPVIFEFSVMPDECGEGFKAVGDACVQLGKIREKDIPMFFEIRLMELGIEWELADRSWTNSDEDIVYPAKICSHIIQKSGAELYIYTIWESDYSLSNLVLQREMPDDCAKFLPVAEVAKNEN